MKRIIILAGAITLLAGTTLFGAMGNNENVQNTKKYVAHSGYTKHGGRHHNNCCYNNGNERGNYVVNKDLEANRIAIAEKKLELRKEMLKDNPDWNRVEKLNQDIASKRAENQTIRMRERATNNQ